MKARLLMAVVLGTLSSPSFAQEASSLAALQSRRLVERTEIILRGYSADKEANDPGTPAYFLGIDPSALKTDIRALESVRTVRLNVGMWSGYFWPNYQGGVANRFNDPNFPKNGWGRARDYVRRRTSDNTNNNLLSPAEKYDIVMGVSPEEQGSLTSHQWRMGEDEFNRTGGVETWQGICHGWAPAAINFAVPQKPVVFSSRRGDITFTPDDVKALGSLLYANGRFESAYAGVRCNTNTPSNDGAGRVIAPECFDINPADWHLITTHHLGFNRAPFVIDLMNSSQVWNKPVVAYSYTYNRIGGNNPTNSLESALVGVDEARAYRNGAYRAPLTAWVLGVSMTITYLDGGFVTNGRNNTKEATYTYDLELDSNYRIIGGEWNGTVHPDFAWKPRFVSLPKTDGDGQVFNLKPWEAALTPSWREPALRSNIHGAPLTKFVKYLFDYASY